MLTKLYTLVFALFLFLFCTKTNAQNLDEKLPLDTSIKMGKLTNGLTYIIRHNKTPGNKVELRLVENAGSILEEDNQQGLAHLTEHMAFNGTTHFEKNELVDFLQKMGVQFGADLNAYTGFDETVYILPIPLSDTGNLRKGLSVLKDWASGLTFDPAQISSERPVVLEEARLGKGAEDRMFRKLYPVQYEGSRYAQRLPIGIDSIVRSTPDSNLIRFYKTWYRPDLQAVIIVGDVDVNKTEQLVKEYFGGLKNPAAEKERFYASVPARQASRALVVTDKEATNYIVQVQYPIRKEKQEITLRDYRDDLIKNLFTSLLNQRLSDLSHGSQPPYLYAAAGYGSEARNYESFNAFTVAGGKGPDTALIAMMTEVERAKEYGFTETELERARKDQTAAIEQLYNNRAKTESGQLAAEYIRLFLTAEPSPGIAAEYNYYKQLMPGITLKEVNSLADSLKSNENIFVSLQGPANGNFKLPDSTQLLALAKTVLNSTVKPYEEKTVATQLMKTTPVAGKVASEKKNAELGVTEITYANGAKVILKPTTFKDDEIVLTSFRKGGQSLYGAADKQNVTFASNIIQQMGIGNFSPTDLSKVLSGKTASASPYIGRLSSGITGGSSVKDVETMLQLVYLYATSPRKDDGLYKAWIEKVKSATQFALQDPETAFKDTFNKVRYAGNPLAPISIPSPSDFDKTNLDRILSIYKEQLGNAQDFTFIFVGNIDTVKMKPLLATYIGGLPSTKQPATFKDNGLRPTKGDEKFTFKKGTEPKSLIVNVYSGEVPYSEDLDLKVSALSEILNIKITEDIREKMSAIYSVNIYGGLQKYPYSGYALVMQLPTGPEHVDTVLKAAQMEIDSIKQFGPAQVNLDKVKKTWLEQHKVSVKENSYWSSKLQGIYFNNDAPQRIFDYEKLVNAITVADIKATANQLFNNKNVLQAVLLPEK